MRTHDYIVEVIEQFAQAIGRILGLRDEKRYDEAEAAIGDALDAAFGPMRGTLEEVTPDAVVELVGREDKLRLYCGLLREAARIAAARGEEGRARRLGARAGAIEEAARGAVSSLS